MSEDGFSDPYDEPSMDLLIETLTGATFDVRVYPTDTILDIKKKIQRVEGIPVHHQNLLFRLEEMKDCKRLCDVGIVNGSTLKLVLAMRGGPISTRRLSACDHQLIWKDLKELIEHTREEFGDKLTAGAKVSVLVFKDGEVINLIRVIESDDGSYYPYNGNEKQFPAKMVLLGDGQLEFYNRMQENHLMLEKLAELRKKMADMSLKRQLRNSKPVDFTSGETASAGYVGQKPKTADSIQDQKLNVKILDQFRRDAESLLKLHASQFGDDDEEEEDDEGKDGKLIRSQPEDSIALKEKHRGKNSFYNMLFQEPSSQPPVPPVQVTYRTGQRRSKMDNPILVSRNRIQRRVSEPYIDPEANLPILTRKKSSASATSTKKSPSLSLWGPSRSQSSESSLSSPSTSSSLAESIGLLDTEADNSEKELLSPMRGPCSGTIAMSKVPSRNSVRLTPLLLQNSPERIKSAGEPVELEEEAQEICDIAASKLGLLKRWQSVDCSTATSEEMRSRSATTRRRRSSVQNSSDLEVLDRNFYLPSLFGGGASSSGAGTIPAHYPTKNERVSDLYFGGEDRIARSPLYQRFSQTDSSTTGTKPRPKWPSSTSGVKNKNATDTILNVLNASTGDRELHPLCMPERLPIKDSRATISKIQVDRTRLETLPEVMAKKRIRCAQCNRRLNITTMHDCRCGGVFCAQHRYSEVHGCNYDYKTEGRRLLQRQNPLVIADKLNKL